MNNGNNRKNNQYNTNDENYDMGHDENSKNNRRNSDNVGINPNTLINLNGEQPVGIDMNGFMNDQDIGDQTIHSISQSNDLLIIEEVNK